MGVSPKMQKWSPLRLVNTGMALNHQTEPSTSQTPESSWGKTLLHYRACTLLTFLLASPEGPTGIYLQSFTRATRHWGERNTQTSQGCWTLAPNWFLSWQPKKTQWSTIQSFGSGQLTEPMTYCCLFMPKAVLWKLLSKFYVFMEVGYFVSWSG